MILVVIICEKDKINWKIKFVKELTHFHSKLNSLNLELLIRTTIVIIFLIFLSIWRAHSIIAFYFDEVTYKDFMRELFFDIFRSFSFCAIFLDRFICQIFAKIWPLLFFFFLFLDHGIMALAEVKRLYSSLSLNINL